VIRAIIFDFDGLILETEGPSYQSWAEVYQSFGLTLPFSTWSSIIGTSQGEFDPRLELQRQVKDKVDWEMIETRRQASEKALIERHSVLPGVEQYIIDARRLGLYLGLASSSSRNWVVGHLTRLGLLSYFDCICASDDVRHTKPDPELYQAVLLRLDVGAEEAIALEDSPNGIKAAKQAGIFCVAVPNLLTSQLTLSQADLRLDSLAEMPLEQLLNKVNSR
jgi:HAD superfamily hydrolase (TIGR01509 family)